jgi:hypothetical protein
VELVECAVIAPPETVKEHRVVRCYGTKETTKVDRFRRLGSSYINGEILVRANEREKKTIWPWLPLDNLVAHVFFVFVGRRRYEFQ